MGSSSKNRTTMAKMNRERAVREKRARKQEKREEKKIEAEADRQAAALGYEVPVPADEFGEVDAPAR